MPISGPPPKKTKAPTSIAATVKVKKVAPVVEEPSPTVSKKNTLASRIQKYLKFATFEPESRYWLDTGSEDLNASLGSRDKGVRYGNIVELCGEEHHGKTMIALILAGIAQRDGAAIGYIDLEDSRDSVWASKLGLDLDDALLIYPKLVKSTKKGKPTSSEIEIPRLQGIEELFTEAEVGMAMMAETHQKQLWIIDSVANMQTVMAIDAGSEGQNMRTRNDRALFLAQALPRWSGLAANYNAIVILINQMRNKMGLVFGDPLESPGGRALRHACAVRARVRKKKSGVLKTADGRVLGKIGTIANFKNKAGGGSVPEQKCAFRVLTTKTPHRITFMPFEDAE